ncbi:MAG: putative membrane protein [Kiritimatiellia bacterium]
MLVLPDHGVTGVPESAWATIRDLLIDSLRKVEPTQGLVAAIAQCGETLAERCPGKADDVDELSNELQFID